MRWGLRETLPLSYLPAWRRARVGAAFRQRFTTTPPPEQRGGTLTVQTPKGLVDLEVSPGESQSSVAGRLAVAISNASGGSS